MPPAEHPGVPGSTYWIRLGRYKAVCSCLGVFDDHIVGGSLFFSQPVGKRIFLEFFIKGVRRKVLQTHRPDESENKAAKRRAASPLVSFDILAGAAGGTVFGTLNVGLL